MDLPTADLSMSKTTKTLIGVGVGLVVVGTIIYLVKSFQWQLAALLN